MNYRATMEKHLGRKLLKGEVVHHINRDRSDNRIENLTVMNNSEHNKLHQRIRKEEAIKNPKIKKIRDVISVEKDIKEEFTKVCKEKAINRSAWIEQKMKEFIQENKK